MTIQDSRRALRYYQRDAFYYTIKRKHSALFPDMRLGKTLITLRSIEFRFPHLNFCALIVAPFSALNSWTQELEKEGFTEEDYTVLIGRKRKRKELLELNRKFYLINREGWLALPEIADVKWNAMVCDESTFLKAPPKVNRSTKWNRPSTSKFFTENFRNVKYRYILTGTPMPNSELDIFMQLRFLDHSILPFDTFWSFRNKFFINMGYDGYYLSEKGKKYLEKKLAKHCFFLSRKDVNLGGEKIYSPRYVRFPKKICDIYSGIWDNYVKELDGKIIDVTDFAVAKFVWARQLCGGFLYDENNNIPEFIWQGKLIELLDLINGELKKEKIVIWVEFTAEIDMLHIAINNRTKRHARFINGSIPPAQRHQIVEDFWKDRCDILICQPRCFQYGADLSCADTEIYYSSPLSLETRMQSEDRLVSIKSDSTLIIDMIVKDTIEEDIYESIRRKENAKTMWNRIVRRIQDNRGTG